MWGAVEGPMSHRGWTWCASTAICVCAGLRADVVRTTAHFAAVQSALGPVSNECTVEAGRTEKGGRRAVHSAIGTTHFDSGYK